ncbi:HD domain-containing protein, partial [candidate division GN15 bacterium]|nr:HD domain-containing protein [candidate division GN15 bacterium]
INAKDLRTTSNGSLYIHCVLSDRTGQILGRIWQANESMYEQIPEGGFLRFRGRVENYKGSLQFVADAIMPVNPDTVDLADFLPKTEENVDEMFDRVKEILRTIRSKPLLALVKQFITDEPLMARLRTAPAAMQMHHAFIGGLLEHTRNVLELALVVIPRYPKVSLDLVLAGVFLHDLGKTTELTYQTNFGYTDRGQLVGHIVQSAMWIEDKARAVEAESGEPFPEDIKTALQHIVLSHHGVYEYGSPKLPAMPEAIAVHYLDNIDAKLQMFMERIESDPDAASDWTQYIRGLDTKLYKKDVMGIRP